MSLSWPSEFCLHFKSSSELLPSRLVLACSVSLYPKSKHILLKPIHVPYTSIAGLEDAFFLTYFPLITDSFKGQLAFHEPQQASITVPSHAPMHLEEFYRSSLTDE